MTKGLIRLLDLRQITKDKGATAIEYALIASLVSVIIVSAVTIMGSKINSLFETVAGSF